MAAGDAEAAVGWLAPLERDLDGEGVLLLARACRESGAADRAAAVLQRGLERLPSNEPLWQAFIDAALNEGGYTLAQRRIGEAQRRIGRPTPPLQFRAAQAYFRLGQALGTTAVRDVPGGRAGQFTGKWLLVEKRVEPHRFLCCPRASALYQLRRALDAGLDEPAAHVLHARIWQRADRPAVGLTILQSREAVLRESGGAEALTALAELALDAGALRDFLRYSRLRAKRQPEQRTPIMSAAFLALAERYNQRGDSALSTAFLRRALELRPADTALMLRLADADWESRRHEEAVGWYRRALEKGPATAERARILERLAAWQAELEGRGD